MSNISHCPALVSAKRGVMVAALLCKGHLRTHTQTHTLIGSEMHPAPVLRRSYYCIVPLGSHRLWARIKLHCGTTRKQALRLCIWKPLITTSSCFHSHWQFVPRCLFFLLSDYRWPSETSCKFPCFSLLQRAREQFRQSKKPKSNFLFLAHTQK